MRKMRRVQWEKNDLMMISNPYNPFICYGLWTSEAALCFLLSHHMYLLFCLCSAPSHMSFSSKRKRSENRALAIKGSKTKCIPFDSTLLLSLTFTCHGCWLCWHVKCCQSKTWGAHPKQLPGRLQRVLAPSRGCKSLMDTPISQVCAKIHETVIIITAQKSLDQA